MNAIENAQFRASAGSIQGFGTTPREALDALLAHLPGATVPPILILPYNRGDAFFTEEQQARLQELKSRRDNLTVSEREEWERLVEASFDATVARTQALQNVKP